MLLSVLVVVVVVAAVNDSEPMVVVVDRRGGRITTQQLVPQPFFPTTAGTASLSKLPAGYFQGLPLSSELRTSDHLPPILSAANP